MLAVLGFIEGSTTGRLVLFVGLFTIFVLAAKLLVWVYNSFVRPPVSLKKYVDAGKWAVITGASDGIGKGFAEVLAGRGVNLLLVSRTAAKLDALAAELSKQAPSIKVETVAVDFAQPDDRVYPPIEAALRGKQVSILVNNVGINSTETPERYIDQPVAVSESVVRVNINSMLRMTSLVLPKMIENRLGLIVNLGSFSGTFPVPLMAVYGATKAFIDNWSTAMSEEYRRDGVTIMCSKPYFVASNMSGFRSERGFTVSATRFVRETLARVGRDVSVSPAWRHNIIEFVSSLLPIKTLLQRSYSVMQGVRNRRLKRKEDSKKSQ